MLEGGEVIGNMYQVVEWNYSFSKNDMYLGIIELRKKLGRNFYDFKILRGRFGHDNETIHLRFPNEGIKLELIKKNK